MATFEDRKDAFENKFAHDAEMRFKADARRNRLLGRWAAELLGLEGDAVEDYAAAVVKSDFQQAGEEDVYAKVAGDLGSRAQEATIRAKMAELTATAREQIASEG